ncbi:MAG: acyltransferase [Prevotellaceae bacterium]|nr:acyltransferase [Prevotellaceae bacterium]
MKRIAFIDYIRVIACFLVMLVHSSENFYGADASGMAGNFSMLANESNRFWVAFYDGTIARTCVPLFIIISSFLLVPMKEGQTMHAFYRRRFTKILPPFILFLLLYTFVPVLMGIYTMDDAMKDLKMLPFNFPSMAGHLWFMYPLISLYLIIPIVSPWLQRATAKEERTFIYIFAFSTLIPWLHRFVSQELWGECFWNNFTMLWYCSGYLGYLVLAHYIRYHIHWQRSKRLRIGAICFLVGALFTGWSFWIKGIPGQMIETPMLEWSWEFCTPNVLLATFGAFLMFTGIEQETAPRFITGVARLSFGMYLMHIFFLAPIATYFVNGNAADPLLPVWLCIPTIAILTFLCCMITTKLISFIPGSKYIIG